MSSLKEFAAKWKTLINDPDLPQPLKSIAEFVNSEMGEENHE